MLPVVEIKNVSKHFRIPLHKTRTLREAVLRKWRGIEEKERKIWALRDISLEINQGEMVGIIGPNGSGKSTLLKILSGVLQPTQGEVIVREPSLSLLELGAGFRRDLTGIENLRMYAALFGLRRYHIQEFIEKAVDFAELDEFIDLPVRSYSSGMRARLAMSAAVSMSAPVIIIDEVLAVGDASFREKSIDRLVELNSQGHTILLVSHNLESVQSLCERVIVLIDGQVANVDEPFEAIWYYLQKVNQERARKRRAALGSEQSEEEEERPPLEILELELINEEGDTKETFRVGDQFFVRVKYRANEPIDNPNFQVQLFAYPTTGGKKEAVMILGTNSSRAGLELGKVTGEGSFTIRYDHFPLLSGDCFFRVVALPSAFGSSPFDVKTNLAPFTVESKWQEGSGLVEIPHVWLENDEYH